jgi:EpsI family protein
MTESNAAPASEATVDPRTRRAVILAGGMVLATAAADVGRRWIERADVAPPPELTRHIPARFAAWREVETAPLVVNPQTQQLLDKIYSEVVARTYVNAVGYHVMLSAAYGRDHRGGLEAHKPEVCYPAQGFTIHEQRSDRLPHGASSLPVQRLRTSLNERHEPLTYWFSVAESVLATASSRRINQVRSLLTGTIPDGILMRVSSIDRDAARAWQQQDAFITDLLRALPEPTRLRVAGPASTTS